MSNRVYAGQRKSFTDIRAARCNPPILRWCVAPKSVWLALCQGQYGFMDKVFVKKLLFQPASGFIQKKFVEGVLRLTEANRHIGASDDRLGHCRVSELLIDIRS